MRKGAVVLLALGLLWLAPVPAQTLELVPAGQVAAQWPFDTATATTTPDVSGNNNTGTLVGTPTFVTGLFRTGMNCSGAQSVSVANSASLDVAAGDFTVAAWINPTNVANKQRVLNKWSGTVGFHMDINAAVGGGDAGGNLRMHLNDGTTNVDYVFAAGLATGNWFHIAVVVNRTSKQMLLYANGSQIGTTQDITALTGSLTNTTVLEIGAMAGAPFYTGIIDEPILYKRALSGAEITTLGTQPPLPPGGVQATAGVNSAILQWNTSAGAMSYTVLRATKTGGPYTPVQSNITALTYTDTGVSNPTQYFYVIDAVGVSGVGQDSAEVNCTPKAAQILVSPTSLAVAQNGGTAFFTVTLVTNPTANVTVPITSANAGALTLTAPGGTAQGSISLLFTPGGASSQQVMVTGVQRFSGNPLTVLATFGTVTSTDMNYSGANYMPSVSCVISPDAAGIVVLPPSGLATMNGGSPIQFTVQLATVPQGTAILNLSVTDPNLATVGPLKITTASPSVAVTVTVTPMNADPQTTYIGPYDIIIDSSASGDPQYAALGQTLVPIDTPVSLPPLTKVWGGGGCGLTGLEGLALLGALAAWRRRRRR
jgi:hypothetical protein